MHDQMSRSDETRNASVQVSGPEAVRSATDASNGIATIGHGRNDRGVRAAANIDDHVRAIEHVMRALIGPDAALSCDLRAPNAAVQLPSAAIEGAMLQLVNHARACCGILQSVGIRTRRVGGHVCVMFVYRSIFARPVNCSTARGDSSLVTARSLVRPADGQFHMRFSESVGAVVLLSFPVVAQLPSRRVPEGRVAANPVASPGAGAVAA